MVKTGETEDQWVFCINCRKLTGRVIILLSAVTGTFKRTKLRFAYTTSWLTKFSLMRPEGEPTGNRLDSWSVETVIMNLFEPTKFVVIVTQQQKMNTEIYRHYISLFIPFHTTFHIINIPFVKLYNLYKRKLY